MTIDELIQHLRQILPDILADTPVTLAYLYGSAATGRMLPHSDVDVALVLCQPPEPKMLPRKRLHLEFAVEAALEEAGVSKPDVRIIDGLPLMFRGQVATQGIRLYSKDEVARVEFETRTWKEYLDYAPVARMFREAFFDKIRKQGLG